MENVVLTIHLLLTIALIGVVLLQRSEGGGLGMGGGGGAVAGRSAGTAMGKLTWILGIGLFVTSMALTIIAAEKSAGSSVLDRLGAAPRAEEPAETGLDGLETLTPPAEGDDAPLAPTAE
ncbi:preprotein translocase subunit SecG [Roseovarius sp. SCSIO 43702]|uniref:preprotein translocase subunit SecG n=1 Tax=Roseovarius sp. SCSIO 43702 TaxID=2823043 RepID=UPI001C72F067|nr:preprotein translocase subunit SecG [Roseovarius sp. SCSIO 43702]QYX55544.1 preprotein translocase subunit SecG [Roseovarius sp. SCSIO 43702]